MPCNMCCFNLFVLSVVGHLFGDFALQGEGIATKKAGVNRYMLAHVLIVTFTTVAPLLLSRNWVGTVVSFIVVLFTHLGMDNIKNVLTKGDMGSLFWRVLCLDQIFHVVIIFALLKLMFSC